MGDRGGLGSARRFGLDPGSKTGEGVRVVGRPEMAGRVLTVILIPEEHPLAGAWLGVTARVARGRDLRDYDMQGAGDKAGASSEAIDEEEERGR